VNVLFKLAGNGRKVHQFEQQLAAILHPGQVLLLQKFGSSLFGAKECVILGKEPNTATAKKVR
jgi:hypothetical protein